jgi:hypothetical protein
MAMDTEENIIRMEILRCAGSAASVEDWGR